MTACAFCGLEHCLVHCVYCLTDCTIHPPQHGPACPIVTNVYPIRPNEFPHGLICTGCQQFVTDFYSLVDHGSYRLITCIVCADIRSSP